MGLFVTLHQPPPDIAADLFCKSVVSRIEGTIPYEFGSDARLIPGSSTLLASLTDSSCPWAIVTSGTRALATGWLDVLKLTHPAHMIVAEDVENGKPDPACYRLGRKRLDLEAEDKRVLVVEDAPAGIRAGKAAGCVVVALLTTHNREEVVAAGADWVVADLENVTFLGKDEIGSVRLQLTGKKLTGGT
jgi:glycerol 3-phosphatase-1